MTNQEKITLALKALDDHLTTYAEADHAPTIPQRLRDFWATGEAFKYDNLCLPKGTVLPGWDEESTFRLHLMAPRWDNLLVELDDAVVGPEGDWEQAYKYIPIFVGGVQGDFCIVVRLDKPNCPVGLFEEANWDDNDEETPDGIYPLANSLDAFLASLTELDADVDMDMDETAEKEAYYSEEDLYGEE